MLNAPLLTAAVDAVKTPDLRRKLLFTYGMLVAYGTPNLINFSTGGGAPIIKNFGIDQDPLGTLAIVISMTAGTLVLVWMGGLITQYGVGQGVSIIIFGGIIARLPDQIPQSFAAGHADPAWHGRELLRRQQQTIAENLQRQNGFILGIRPGRRIGCAG